MNKNTNNRHETARERAASQGMSNSTNNRQENNRQDSNQDSRNHQQNQRSSHTRNHHDGGHRGRLNQMETFWQQQDERLAKMKDINLTKDDVHILPLGGIGEIGMNALCYHHQGRWLLTDCGNSFDRLYSNVSHIVVPSVTFFQDKLDKLDAIIITHGHEDHIGALPYLWENLQVPIYSHPFTLALIRRKFEEKGLPTDKLIPIEPAKWYDIGTFKVKWILVSHSIPGSCMVAFRTKHGSILHTGDWKIDDRPLLNERTDMDSLAELASEDLSAIICDSTNVSDPGLNPTEEEVCEHIETILKRIRNGRIFVTFFSTNISRLYACIEGAKAAGRKVGILGRSLQRTYEVAIETGLMQEQDHVLLEGIENVPADKIVIACSGSQGEQNSALRRIAEARHNFIKIDPEDTIIFSSRVIPTNSKEVVMLENALLRRGVNIITRHEELVHTSGHPRQGDLDIFYGHIAKHSKDKSKIWVLPCHGTSMFLHRHSEFAHERGFRTFAPGESFYDGKIYKVSPNVEYVASIDHEVMFLDGRNIISTQSPIVAERKILQEGYISIALLVSKNKQVLHTNVSSYGVHEDKRWLEYEIFKIIQKVMRNPTRNLQYSMHKTIKYEISQFVRKHMDKFVHVELHILNAGDKIRAKTTDVDKEFLHDINKERHGNATKEELEELAHEIEEIEEIYFDDSKERNTY